MLNSISNLFSSLPQLSALQVACISIPVIFFIAPAVYGKYLSNRHQKEIDDLNNKLTDALLDDLSFNDLVHDDEGLSFNVRGNIINCFSEAFIGQFKSYDACNYLEFGFIDKQTADKYLITLQKVNGLTPAEKASRVCDAATELMNAKNDADKLSAIAKIKNLIG